MLFRKKIPLAWKNLTHDWRRLATAAGGVGFAVFLIFIETGFLHALLDSTAELVKVLNTDLVLASKSRFALVSIERFDRRRLDQARSLPEIAGAYPLFVETQMGMLKNVDHKVGYPIRVVAYDLSSPVFDGTDVGENSHLINRPNSALVDAKTKRKYQLPTDDIGQLRKSHAELENRRVHLMDTFSLGTDFSTDGSLIMSDQNYAQYFPYAAGMDDPMSRIDLGLVQLKEGANVKDAKQQLAKALQKFNDVDVFTKAEFMAKERMFWLRNTPVAFVFVVGTVMGFIVGIVICYQIIFTDVTDHLPEFATLKAMGYADSYFLGLVLKESLYLSVLGFIPGVLASFATYAFLAAQTGLLLRFSAERVLTVFGLTALMCVVSGCLAIRKIVSADPADLF